MHKIPANFNEKIESYPFKPNILKVKRGEFAITFEPKSIVYDSFNDNKVKINNIDQKFELKGAKLLAEYFFIKIYPGKRGCGINKAEIYQQNLIGSYLPTPAQLPIYENLRITYPQFIYVYLCSFIPTNPLDYPTKDYNIKPTDNSLKNHIQYCFHSAREGLETDVLLL